MLVFLPPILITFFQPISLLHRMGKFHAADWKCFSIGIIKQKKSLFFFSSKVEICGGLSLVTFHLYIFLLFQISWENCKFITSLKCNIWKLNENCFLISIFCMQGSHATNGVLIKDGRVKLWTYAKPLKWSNIIWNTIVVYFLPGNIRTEVTRKSTLHCIV